jgi:hypothetical protein
MRTISSESHGLRDATVTHWSSDGGRLVGAERLLG